MNIYNLKTNHILNPIGFLMDTVTLSWIIDAPFEEELQGTRVLIALDENFEEVIHDSGMHSDLDPLCYQPKINLLPRTRYFWKVTVKNAGGDELLPKSSTSRRRRKRNNGPGNGSNLPVSWNGCRLCGNCSVCLQNRSARRAFMRQDWAFMNCT